MNLLWIVLAAAAVAALGAVVVLLRGLGRDDTRHAAARRSVPGGAQTAAAAAAAAAGPRTAGAAPVLRQVQEPADAPAPTGTLPPAVAALHGVLLAPLDDARRHAVIDRFRNVPRPPRLLTQLVSMDLMHAASSQELTGLVSGEPLIAAKVLAAVNSPAYGLTRSVASIGQAVTYLGLNSVRAICMQYVLTQTFQADSPERARRLTALWAAGALACELTQHPAQRVALPDAGGLTSAVVLSFLGDVAISVGVPAGVLPRLPARDAVQRLGAEHALLGLTGPTIGRALMLHWDLPPSIVAEVDGLSQALVRPFTHRGDMQGLRWAFGHLCVRLGERLAWGELARIEDFDLAADSSDELAGARSFLAEPVFAALVQALRSPQVALRMGLLMQGLRPAAGAHAVARTPARVS